MPRQVKYSSAPLQIVAFSWRSSVRNRVALPVWVQFGCNWDGNNGRIGLDGRKPPNFVEYVDVLDAIDAEEVCALHRQVRSSSLRQGANVGADAPYLGLYFYAVKVRGCKDVGLNGRIGLI